jgi:hypothetical protein
MNRILFLIFLSIPIFSFGQIENKWQPDSIYTNRQVKKIFVYMNSPKDLSEIIEFDRTGKRIRSTKYSASYNRKTRKRKWIEKINLFDYNNKNQLIKIIDSIGRDSIIFKYDCRLPIFSTVLNYKILSLFKASWPKWSVAERRPRSFAFLFLYITGLKPPKAS